jgi:hypothetical protein
MTNRGGGTPRHTYGDRERLLRRLVERGGLAEWRGGDGLVAQLADELGVPYQTCIRWMRELEAEGRVRRTGHARRVMTLAVVAPGSPCPACGTVIV